MNQINRRQPLNISFLLTYNVCLLSNFIISFFIFLKLIDFIKTLDDNLKTSSLLKCQIVAQEIMKLLYDVFVEIGYNVKKISPFL